MTIANTAALLESAQKDFEAKKQQLEADFLKRKSELLQKVKAQLAESLAEAAKVFAAIPENAREGVYSEAEFAKLLDALGLQQGGGQKPRKQRQRTPRVADEQILGYLSAERKTSDVEKHFKLSAVTIGKRLGDLLKAKQVTVRREGTSKLWKKV
ncbi:MAG TPA: hypothetical protein P5205_05800 [Candidatus Paceibacterota bacterium]|nr:hypothetical protein [Verrucomicrobiota bacterium]HSA09867.1 hypothetical protein [Candidatus Paceibacterota bacterium]